MFSFRLFVIYDLFKFAVYLKVGYIQIVPNSFSTFSEIKKMISSIFRFTSFRFTIVLYYELFVNSETYILSPFLQHAK